MPSCEVKIGQMDINHCIELGGSAVGILWEQDRAMMKELRQRPLQAP